MATPVTQSPPLPSLAGKTAWSALSVLVLTAGRFIAGIILARTLGPALSGQAIYLMWLADSISLIASLGLQSTVTRFTAELRAQGRVGDAQALLRWALLRYAFMQSLVAAALAIFLPASAAWCCVLYSAGQAVNSFVTAWLAGQQRFDLTARLNTAAGVVLIVAAAIGCRFGVSAAVLAYASGMLPAMVLGWRVLAEAAKGDAMPRDLRARALRYGLFTCFAAVVSAFVWSRTEIVFLTRCSGFHAVAMFNVGLSLSTMGSQAATLLTGGLVPHFAGLAGTGDLATMRRTYSSLTRLVALVVFPVAFGFAALAPALIPLLYGRSFEEAVPTAAILALLASLSAANVGSALVYGREKSAFIAVSGALGAVLAIVGGMTLVPAWGSLGAAASRAVVQLCMVGLGTWYIRTRLDCPFPWHAIARTAAASALAGLPGYAIAHVRSDLPGLTAACFAIATSYALLVRILGLFRTEDAAIIHRILGALPKQFARPITAAARWLAGLTYAHADYVSVQ